MIRALSPTLLLLAAGAAAADETMAGDSEEMTDMEFLEYLGSWDGVDAEWELFDAARATKAEPTDDAEPEPDAEQEEVEDSES